ncbi:MAG: ACT domain-containing protein [Burkholderiales bacterium]|nr:ACT domain-containing protein [Burkholderiales bacterium]
MTAISNLHTLLASMEPVLNDGVFAFASLHPGYSIGLDDVVATIRESEGLSIVLPEARALALQLPVLFRCAWITLTVHSDLQAVGLTAAFARALGDAGISCNVVAGAYHDHIFVPVERAQDAMAALRQLQQSAG